MTNTVFDALFAPLDGSDRTFLILADGTGISRSAFAQMVRRAAGALVAAGVRPGDRVAAQVSKSPMALAVYGAAIAAGAVFLPLNTAYTAQEVAYFIGDASPRLLLVDPARADEMAEIAAAHGTALKTLDAAGKGSFADLAARQPAQFATVPRGPDDLAALLYTSGTTGRAKGAMLTHGNLMSNAQALASEWRFTDKDVLLHALPIFHTHGLFVATNLSLLTGGAMIFLQGLNIDQMIAIMPRATAMMGVPTFYTRLLDDPRFDAALTAHMRVFISGSAPLLAQTHQTFEARTGHRILERYGMTETNMNTSNPYDGERRAGTVGHPLPGVEVRLTDPTTGAILPQGAVGVIEVRGPNVFAGYWQMPEKTAEEFRDDGFFVTGDLGRFDDDGYLSIVGRQKDLIITGGFNVYPKELELILDDLPGVGESAVIGVPHPDFGEAVIAVIVPAVDGMPDLAEIDRMLRDAVAAFKRPKAVMVLDALPRNAMGKVQKNLLRMRFETLFSKAG